MKPILALALGLSACSSVDSAKPALSVASIGGMDWSREYSFTANVTASNPTSANVAFWGVNGEEPVARYKYFWEGQWVEDEAVWQTCGTGLYVGELSAGGTVDLDAYILYPQLPSKVGVGFWKPSEEQMPSWFEWDWYWTDVGALDFSSQTPSQRPESPPSLRIVDAKGQPTQELFIYFKVPRGEDLTQTSKTGHIWLQDSVKSTLYANMVWAREMDNTSNSSRLTLFDENLDSRASLAERLKLIHSTKEFDSTWTAIHVQKADLDSLSPGQVAQQLGVKSVRIESTSSEFRIERAVPVK